METEPMQLATKVLKAFCILEGRKAQAALHLLGGHMGRKAVNIHSEGDLGCLVEQGGLGIDMSQAHHLNFLSQAAMASIFEVQRQR